MPAFHLTPQDWGEFNDLFPGCWLWLQQRSLRRELELMDAKDPSVSWDSRRLVELRVWAEVMAKAGAKP